ncbi:MAG: SufE [Chlamydiales bacterium 38-26]|nr:SufE family protein [Chlamydiales bacterium]OJV08534.1 MAG: SufE [Chlamydiales bacterium 38-26]
MSTTFNDKQKEIVNLFKACSSEDDKYKKIIEFGKKLPLLEEQYKVPENIVKGCQSIMYLRSFFQNDLVYFQASSEALISAGLAALLIYVYSGETPETILTTPPHFLDELGINANLTPSRANGLYSVHLRMKQEALKILVGRNRADSTGQG